MQVVHDTRWVNERPTACLIKGASRRSEKIALGGWDSLGFCGGCFEGCEFAFFLLLKWTG